MSENNENKVEESKKDVKSFVEVCKESLDHIVELSKTQKIDKRNDVREYMRKVDNIIGQLKVHVPKK